MKKIFTRALMGMPIGVAICTVNLIILSLVQGGGEYVAAPQELISSLGELRAVILQTALTAGFGAVWGGASVIWEIESWSLLRMTLTHLAICSAVTFPTAYILRWMPRTPIGAVWFFGVYAIYAGIWAFEYGAIKRQVDAINGKIGKLEDDGGRGQKK